MKTSDFFQEKVKYDSAGQYVWAVDKAGGHQMVAELRGWGAIQNLFKNKDGSIRFDEAEKYQDEVGEFVAAAINEKLQRDKEKEFNPASWPLISQEEYISIETKVGLTHQRNWEPITEYFIKELSEFPRNTNKQLLDVVKSKNLMNKYAIYSIRKTRPSEIGDVTYFVKLIPNQT